jgi:hypothetical protein
LYKENTHNVKMVAENAMRQWVELQLIEVILGMRMLQNSKEWTEDDIQRALSEEALTAAVMQRYHMHIAMKRDLGTQCGASE